MKKKTYSKTLLLLFVLLFGVSLRPHVAQAAQPDSYVRDQINNHYRNYTNYYEVDGYLYYQSYSYDSNRATHYEGGLGRWTDAKPYPTVNTLYNPSDVQGKRTLGQAKDWGFIGHNTVWAGSRQSRPSGIPANRNVRYERFVKVTYRRDKTTPVTEGISDPSSNVYVSGKNWWVKPDTQFRLTVTGYQNYDGFGKRLPLRDYVSSNYLRIEGEGQELRSQMYRDGGLNTFRTTSHFKVSRNTSSLSATNRRFNSRYNLRAMYSGKKYDIYTYTGSQNGKTHGYIDTGIDLRTDGVAPTVSFSPNGGDWKNSNTSVKISASDSLSGVKRIRHRLYSNGSWGSWSGWTNGSSKTVTISAAGTQYLQVQAEDNVGNTRSVSSNNYHIDKTLPNGTISGNPTNWTNQNVTLTFKATDTGGSGVRRVRQSGGSWVNGSTTSRTVSSNGTYSFEVEDNAGNKRTVSATVNRIDKTAPNGTISQNPTGWTNGNVTLTFTATDSGGSGVRRVRQSGGSWVNGSTTSRTVSENGSYSFEVEDNAGNTRTVSATVNRIDKDSPAPAFNHNPSTWTNGNVTTTIRARDFGPSGGTSGVSRYRFRQQGGTWSSWTTYGNETELSSAWFEKTRTITSNGTYEVQVQDRAGNTASRSFTVDWIDKTAPNGTISGNPTSWTNQNVTLTFNATDTGGSGVRRVRVAGGSWVNGSTTSRTVSSNGTYSFEVEDNAGNKRTVSATVNRIDKTLPNATFSPNSASWQNTNRAVTVTATDSGGSGFKQLRTRVETNGTWGSWSGWTTSSTKNLTASTEGKTRFQVQVQDNAGNTRTVTSGTYHIDKTLPNATFSPNSASWQNSNRAVTVTATDSGGSGYKQLRTRVETNGTWGGWSGWQTGSTKSLTASTNGKTRFQVQVQDNAGNARTVTSGTYHIDKVAPTVNAPVIHDARYVSGNDYWYRPGDNLRVDISGTDAHSGITYSYLRLSTSGSDNRAIYRWGDSSFSEFSTATYSTISQGTILENGTTKRYRFNASVKSNSDNQDLSVYSYFTDVAGNIIGYIDSGRRVRVDGTAPTVSASPSSRAWGNTNANVSLTYSDSRSGVQTKQYAWSTSTATPSSWNNYTGQVSQANDGIWYLHYRTVDRVGNVRTGRFGPYRVDKTLPNANSTQSPTAWTNGNVNITWNASATGSPLSRIRVHNGSTWGAWSAVSGTSSSTVQTVTSNGTYRFQVQDQAGNVREISHTVSNIDKVLPNGTITGNPTSWQNTNATLTFKATDSGGSGVRRVRQSGGSWVNGSTTSRTVTANGTYSFEVEDHAGNKRTVSVTVNRIDKTLPNASKTQSPTAWTNGNVNIAWTANATGSPLHRIRTHNGSTWGAWSAVSGTVHTHTQSVSSNGTYHFQVQDAAGNVRQISHTVSNIDKTLPNMTVTSLNTDWTNTSINIRTTVNDRGDTGENQHISGVQRIRMRQQGGTWSAWRTFSSTSERSSANLTETWTIDENGTYEWQLQDRAGNIRTASQQVTNIDRLPPETSGSFTPDGWTNQTIMITWLAKRTGDPGAPLEAYRYDRGNGNWTSWQNATHSDAFTVTQDVTKNGVYRFDIRDEAGNVARSSVTVTQHDIVLPVGQITARFDRSERDDHVDYTSNDLVDMVDSSRVTVDVTGVEDLGISGVDFVTIEEQRRIGYGGEWMTVGTTDYDWPHPYNTSSQTYAIDVSHAQDTRFILTVTDRAGNTSSRATSNVVRQSVMQFIDFRITDVVNPQLTEEDLAAIRASDLSEDVVELTAGTDVTFDVTYQLRHLDTVDELSGNIRIKTISDDRIHTHDIEVKENTTGHNQHVTFTKTFTVPQGTPKGSEITIVGDLEAKLANGTTHKISYPSNADMDVGAGVGVIDNHIEEFFRFRIVR